MLKKRKKLSVFCAFCQEISPFLLIFAQGTFPLPFLLQTPGFPPREKRCPHHKHHSKVKQLQWLNLYYYNISCHTVAAQIFKKPAALYISDVYSQQGTSSIRFDHLFTIIKKPRIADTGNPWFLFFISIIIRAHSARKPPPPWPPP